VFAAEKKERNVNRKREANIRIPGKVPGRKVILIPVGGGARKPKGGKKVFAPEKVAVRKEGLLWGWK